MEFNDSYDKILEKYITTPYGLKHIKSSLSHPKSVFKSYSYINNSWREIKDFNFINLVGVGGITATSSDLNKFITDLFQGKILKKTYIGLMKPSIGSIVGRGLEAVTFNDTQTNHIFYGHGGDTYGAFSEVGYNKRDSIAICYIINGERYPTNDFAIGIFKIIYGVPFEFPGFKNFNITQEELNKYIGTYSSPELPVQINISKEGNTLMGQVSGQSPFIIEPEGINKFQNRKYNVSIEFSPAQNKMLFKQGKTEIKMEKED